MPGISEPPFNTLTQKLTPNYIGTDVAVWTHLERAATHLQLQHMIGGTTVAADTLHTVHWNTWQHCMEPQHTQHWQMGRQSER